ncbi:MAG: DUF1861 family protein [Acholeplasmataceae bacterium]|jgi:hypothetical protein|nr:DUF1861 family protein [Acholeplasmataceae bacterium]
MTSVAVLLKQFRSQKKYYQVGKLTFKGVEGVDIYNPTAPFQVGEKTIIIARVEKRNEEFSRAMFFYQTKEDEYQLLKDYPVYQLQDPYITKIKGEFIFGGTELLSFENGIFHYQAAFYRGKTLKTLKRFLTGPSGMKDIRLIELKSGKIGVFSRPQGKKGGRGKIGFTIVDKLEDLTAQIIYDAPLLEMIIAEDWLGANELHLLADGKIGVLAHVACFSGNKIRHYYPATFILDPETKEFDNFKIIAERKDFLPGCYKRKDLIDVLFSAGIILMGNKAKLYSGVSDCEVHYALIDNPFFIEEE